MNSELMVKDFHSKLKQQKSETHFLNFILKCSYPTKDWMLDKHADHFYMSQPGRQYNIQHLNFGPGDSSGCHVDVYDRCREFT